MKHNIKYMERVISNKTSFLFIAFTVLFFALSLWRFISDGFNVLTGVFIFFSIFFLFYTINYRTLVIELTDESLKLSFGVFKWTIPINNILDCQLDDNLPLFMKYGGAGIHFIFIKKKYRASFNFLEYPRILISLKKKSGLVRYLSFTSTNPDMLMQQIQAAISSQ